MSHSALLLIMKFDPLVFKKQFPLFDHKENQSLVYLDNAATTQKPQCVIDAIGDFYTRINANANRSSHRLGRAATQVIDATRDQTAHFINAETEEIVFNSGATEGINIIANGLSKTVQADNEIILSIAEHHANLVPWQELAQSRGAKLQYVQTDLSDLKHKLSSKTKIIALTAVSNTLGKIADLSFINEIKNTHPNIIFIVDASQLAAHRTIDVKAINCDFLVFSAHKIYGPSGLGVLYGKKDMLAMLDPLLFGGEMIKRVELFSSHYVSGPERFEAGTSPLAAIAGFNACLTFWSLQDRQAMKQYESYLCLYLYEKLKYFSQSYKDIKILSESENNIGLLSISSDVYSMLDIAYWLDEKNIAVRVGDHCTQPLWKSIGVSGVLRISLAAYNTTEDIDKLIEALTGFMLAHKEVSNSERDSSKNNVDVDELLKLNIWQKKYKKIMQWGKQYSPPLNIRVDENIVAGCETSLWLQARQNNNRYFFAVDSDSTVVKGLALLIIAGLENKTVQEIQCFDFSSYFSSLGLDKYLTQSRVNGLYALVEHIQKLN